MNKTEKDKFDKLKKANCKKAFDWTNYEDAINYWDENVMMEEYRLQEESLNKLFKKYENNNDYFEVLTKIQILDEYYSTQLYKNFKKQLAEDIVDNKKNSFGQLYKSCKNKAIDYELFEKMYSLKYKKQKKKCISFLSKYLSRYFPNNVPIYDANVRMMLCLINASEKFDEEILLSKKKGKLEKAKNYYSKINKNYKSFVAVVDKFIEKFKNMTHKKISYKEFDKYIWSWSKAIINEDYKNGKICIKK